MKSLDLGRYALCSYVAAAMLAGCGGSPPPIGAPDAGPQGRAIATHTERGGSWMLSNAPGQDLLYVSSTNGGSVFVYSYPDGKLVGTLSGLNSYASGECVDAAGDVFITTSNQEGVGTVYEYSHGGTQPIAVLNDPGLASGCAVDPISGNLAVANSLDYSNTDYHGDVAVYIQAQGSPVMYHSGVFTGFFFCAYDNNKNLYLSAGDESNPNQIGLARLANGSGSLETISIDRPIYSGLLFDPSVQWEGKDLAISSSKDPVHGQVFVYHLKISGSNATIFGKTTLSNDRQHHAGQTLIQGKTVLGVSGKGYRNVSMWTYPKGGRPQQTIKKIGPTGAHLWGLTISPGSSH
jgi:hypothetical protein